MTGEELEKEYRVAHYQDVAERARMERVRYLRLFKGKNTPEELTREQWEGYAEGNVINLYVAKEFGFRTGSASYWVESE